MYFVGCNFFNLCKIIVLYMQVKSSQFSALHNNTQNKAYTNQHLKIKKRVE